MTVSGVGSGSATAPTIKTATSAPAAGADPGTGAESGAASTDSYAGGGGEESLLNPDGSTRSGWGTVNAPPEPPIQAFGSEKPPSFGDIQQPPPQSGSGPGITQQSQATAIEPPPSPPLQKTKWSIITGPPQGDG